MTALVLVCPTAFAQVTQKPLATATPADQRQVELQAITLQVEVGQALKLQKIDRKTAGALSKELADVKTSVATLAKQQGFVSAAEKASYQRVFTKVERASQQEVKAFR